MSSACPGPAVIAVSDYTGIALTDATAVSTIDCAAVLYSGSPSQSVQLVFSKFSMDSRDDLLTNRDGDSESSPLLTQLTGSYRKPLRYRDSVPSWTGVKV